MKNFSYRPLKFALLYVLIAVGWIIFSDRLLSRIPFIDDFAALTFFQTLKGTFFVLCTGGLLYFFIRKTESNILARERQYRRMFYDNPLPMWIFDPGKRSIEEVNESALHQYGYSREEFLNISPEDLLPEQNEAQDISSNAHLSFSDRNQTITTIHRRKDKSKFTAEIQSFPTLFQEKPARLVMVVDIEERIIAERNSKLYQKRLYEREEFLNSILNSSTAYIIRLDLDNRFSFANDHFFSRFGYHENEVMGQPFFKTTSPEDFEKIEGALHDCLINPGKVERIVISMPDSENNNKYWTEWEFTSVVNERFDVKEVQGVGLDITERRTAEKSMQHYAKSIERILESISDSFLNLDQSQQITRCNPALEKIVKTKRKDIIGKSIWELFPELEKHEIGKKLISALHTNENKFIKAYYKPLSMWLDFSIYPTGEGLAIYFRDITESKQAEEEREFYLTRLNDMIASITDGIFTIDTDWKITMANKHIYGLTENSVKDPINGNFWSQLLFNDGMPEAELFHETMEEKKPNSFEFRVERRTVNWYYFHLYPTQEGIFVLFQDITQSKYREEALENLNVQYNYVMKATNDTIWDWDIASDTITWNEGIKLVYGFRMDDVSEDAEWWSKHVHPEDRERTNRILENAMKSQIQSFSMEYRFLSAQGEYRYVFDRGYFVYNSKGQATRAIGAMQDIHQSKLYELRIKRQVQQLKQIAWVQSHEVRRPVANILGLLELLEDKELNDAAKQQTMHYIRLHTEELDEMIRQIVEQTKELEEADSSINLQ